MSFFHYEQTASKDFSKIITEKQLLNFNSYTRYFLNACD